MSINCYILNKWHTCNAPVTGTDETAASGLQYVTDVANVRLAWRFWTRLLSTAEDHKDSGVDAGWNTTDCEDANWLLDLSTCQHTLHNIYIPSQVKENKKHVSSCYHSHFSGSYDNVFWSNFCQMSFSCHCQRLIQSQHCTHLHAKFRRCRSCHFRGDSGQMLNATYLLD